MFEHADRAWGIHISHSRKAAERAQKDGFVCIGWTRLGDLRPHDTLDKIKAHYADRFPEKSRPHINTSAGQVFRFAHEMRVGDPIVYPIKGSRDVLLGKIAGDYRFSDDPTLQAIDAANVRPVEWLKRVPRVAFSQAALNSFGAFLSVFVVDDHLPEIVEVLAGREKPPEQANGQGGAGKVSPDVVSEEEVRESEEDARDAVEEATQATKDYLLRQWSRTAQDFEEVVAAVFRALGYTATTQAGTHDLGVDVIAHQDPLGVTPPVLKIQAKSGTSTVGAPAVKQLRGVLNVGEKGVLISLGGFSNDARHTEQNDANLILIDADRFVDLFLGCYEKLSAEMRHKFPLTPVYVVAA